MTGAREGLLRRALLLSAASVVINALSGGSAVVIALSTGSLSLLGFGFDAAIDSAASIALIWRFSIERREPHRAERVERIAEGIVGLVLLVLAAFLALSALRALADGAHPEPTPASLVLLVASIVVLPVLSRAKLRVAAALGSGALRADGFLTAMAALLALISLVGLALSELMGAGWADGVGALAVAAILAREGWGSFRVMRERTTHAGG